VESLEEDKGVDEPADQGRDDQVQDVRDWVDQEVCTEEGQGRVGGYEDLEVDDNDLCVHAFPPTTTMTMNMTTTSRKPNQQHLQKLRQSRDLLHRARTPAGHDHLLHCSRR